MTDMMIETRAFIGTRNSYVAYIRAIKVFPFIYFYVYMFQDYFQENVIDINNSE